jgi:catechol 2,3-dioxygenase-like lactoylglutathione lyase family enzyme
VKPHVAVITLGVKDLQRARRFYSEGLGWELQQEDHNWACFLLDGGSTALALYPWDELAEDATVASDGMGFRGVTLAHNVRSRERVDEILAEAERAGGTVVKGTAANSVGWVRRLFRRPGGIPLGGRNRRDPAALLGVARTYVRNILGPVQTSCKERRTLLSSASTLG